MATTEDALETLANLAPSQLGPSPVRPILDISTGSTITLASTVSTSDTASPRSSPASLGFSEEYYKVQQAGNLCVTKQGIYVEIQGMLNKIRDLNVKKANLAQTRDRGR
ncbi:hypothetical protein BU23DRAFT_571456 [Bimuria novae-zelandiae CBS 107.79]|uniref:Uncharacterized protein n=1 Tax=Bimuria novae-zelandiae CBS 107.79 TaxID=1447943 RepID=A0A6A5UXI6_9PLEO|nr:hypothetical protein BU23DRAFT_571456 [Bimuria novae-zelandiae CBS 107.79]